MPEMLIHILKYVVFTSISVHKIKPRNKSFIKTGYLNNQNFIKTGYLNNQNGTGNTKPMVEEQIRD